jgi:argininosuccinate lyase
MKLANLSLSISLIFCSSNFTVFAQSAKRDEFYWLSQMNKASLVINTEEGLLAKDKALLIAKGLETVIANGNADKSKRPNLILNYEPLLIQASSQDATFLHAGRSSQDMHATYRSAILRDELLALMEELLKTQKTLLSLAEKYSTVVVPNYTNGVAAQPNAFGHYLLGHAAGFERDAQKIRETYVRLNRSAMGTTVLNGTSWPLNRKRMANYLGYPEIVMNAYDAAQISSMEHPVEIGSILIGVSLHVGHFVEDIMTQYAQAYPWIMLESGNGNTYASSAMPQKKNPGLLNDTRADASSVLAMSLAPLIRAHNITPGMGDPKSSRENSAMTSAAIDMLRKFNRMLNALRVNKARALEELNSDWTASQEVADLLTRKYKVPFRISHHFASDLVEFAKTNGIKPTDLKHSDAQKIFKQSMKNESVTADLPIQVEELKSVLNPENIVKQRMTAGGPQPEEMKKMLAEFSRIQVENEKWLIEQKNIIDVSLKNLDDDFAKYLTSK